MNIQSKSKRQNGFSMIEVMIAVAVLSFGLLALAALQTAIIRSSSEAKAQSAAISLAKEKIESFRRYTNIAGFQNIPGASNGIGNDTPPVLGGVTYARSWIVERYVFENDVDDDGVLNETGDQRFEKYTTSITGATPAGYVQNNEFKVVTVTVSWSDANGVTQSVVLDDAIGALSPRDSALIAKTPLGATPRRIPYQIVDPSGDAMVIPIAIGNGTNSAATNPKPQVVVGQSVVETTFEVLTYAGLNGGTATAQQRVETSVLGCTCKYGVGVGTKLAMRPTYWNGYRYAPPVAAAAIPVAGPDPAFANLQSTNCTTCCQNHQDPTGEKGPTFSPRFVTKDSDDVVTGNHPHYADKLTATPVVSGSFKEACRIIRVDGIQRLATDLSNDYFALLATGDGTTALLPTPDSTSVQGTPTVAGGAVKRYQNFVVDYLNARTVTNSPSASAAQGVYNTVGTPATLAASAPYVLDNPASISINLVDLVGKWLHSRGLYVDFLETEAVQAITDAKADSSCNGSTATLSICILKRLPFTSINLSEIADWSPLSGVLSVTNNDYSTSLAQGNPVRGKVTTSATTASTVNGVTSSRKYNTSLLDLSFDAISPNDDIRLTDTQPFAIGGGAPSTGAGNGLVPFTLSYAGTANPALSYLTTGAASTLPCSGFALLASSCNVQNGSATAGLDIDGGIAFDIGGYNHQQFSGSVPSLVNCTGVDGLKTFSAANSAHVGPAAGSVCKNYEVTAVSTTSPAAGTVSWTAAPSSVGDGRINPAPGEVTRISFTGRIQSTTPNSIAIILGLQATVTQTPSSCTYVCDNVNNQGACTVNGQNKIRFTAIYPACP